MSTYTDIVRAITDACHEIGNSINIETGNEDGRITSAIKEHEYLDALEQKLGLKFKKAPPRYWYDFTVCDIPINLKLTMGKTADNAFNKTALLYSITGQVPSVSNMSFNKFNTILKNTPWKMERDMMTEYHYLVVYKGTNKIVFKSIFDIEEFRTNPSNTLQIHWGKESQTHAETKPWVDKAKHILKLIQKSVRQSIETMLEFAQYDIDAFNN